MGLEQRDYLAEMWRSGIVATEACKMSTCPFTDILGLNLPDELAESAASAHRDR